MTIKRFKTLPKAGYSFHATISRVAEKGSNKKTEYKATRLMAVGFFSLLLLFLILYYSIRKNSYIPSESLNSKRAAEISRLDSIHQAEKIKQLNEKRSGNR